MDRGAWCGLQSIGLQRVGHDWACTHTHIFFGQTSVQIFCPLLVSFLTAFWEASICFGYKSFIRYVIGKYFLPDCGLLFHLHNIAFQRSEVLNIDQVQFINFHFLDHVFGVKYAKSSPNSKSQILSVFFSFTFGTMPSSWSTLWKVRTCCAVFLAHRGSTVSAPFAARAQLSLLSCFCWHFVLELPDGVSQPMAGLTGSVSGLSLIPLTEDPFFLRYHTVPATVRSQQLKSGSVNPTLVLIF